MNILVIFTGGTIGSRIQDGVVKPDTATQHELISYYETNHSCAYKFHTLEPLNILSENLQASHWTTLIDAIDETNLTEFDGIIVTHGTDTLSFTANALALYFTKLSLPMVFVSSSLPLNHPDTNGHDNFHAAVTFIKEKHAGVFVSYKNPSEDFVSIFHAHSITQSPQLSSRFNTIHPLVASIKGDQLSLDTLPTKTEPKDKRLKPFFDESILYIKPYPALNYDSFNLQNHKIILHDLYHSGTCDITKLKPFFRHCKRENILLFMAPIAQSNSYYETTQELIDMGVCFLFDITIEHALCKIMFASKNYASTEEFMDYMLDKS